MYTIEEWDQTKTKIMHYILYKKRTEYEVRNKFKAIIEENLLEDIIEYVKQAGYLSDKNYIERSIQEFLAIKTISIKEMKYKLQAKGINKEELEEYLKENQEEMMEYELRSAIKIITKKKQTMPIEQIKQYLLKKGYQSENIKQAIQAES